LSHDLVSMQVTLKDIAKNPGVESATIHDLDNRLLVQAGESPGLNQVVATHQNFTAPITLHDSVAGYVTVTLDIAPGPQEKRLWLLLGCIATLLIALACLVAHRQLTLLNPKNASPETIPLPNSQIDNASGTPEIQQ
jgi:uncharacterized membrane protein affecting hemolysin expression